MPPQRGSFISFSYFIMAKAKTTSPADEFTPRPPNVAEKRELLAWLKEQYGGEDQTDLVQRSRIAVFDDYVTDCPGYGGKVMYVIWPASPSMCSVFLWPDEKMEHSCTHE